jgi:hypothetical protein
MKYVSLKLKSQGMLPFVVEVRRNGRNASVVFDSGIDQTMTAVFFKEWPYNDPGSFLVKSGRECDFDMEHEFFRRIHIKEVDSRSDAQGKTG